MKRRRVGTVVGVAILVGAAAIYIATTPFSGSYSTELKCVDSGIAVFAVNGDGTHTTTVSTSYTTNTTSSATIGHVITANRAIREISISLPPGGSEIISSSSNHSCVYN